jgi:hypothetical protein
VPLPVPEPYLSGLDLTKNIDEIGPGRPESSGSVYVLGQYAEGKGIWYYYFCVLLFKTPIPVILLTLMGLYYSFRQRISVYSTGFIFGIVIAYLLCYFSFFYNSQVGIRHILMIFPLLYVLLGKVAAQAIQRKSRLNILAIYSVATFYFYFPNLIAYSNEFLLPKRKAYHIMADSNIDYGQGYFFIQNYLRSHPDTRFADTLPAAGKFVIGINDYLDLQRTNKYAWLRNVEPVGQVAHCYLLLDVTPASLKKKRYE